VFCGYLNIIGYRKILIEYFMTFYEILGYLTMSFWDIPDAAHWNIREIAFVNLEQFEVSSR